MVIETVAATNIDPQEIAVSIPKRDYWLLKLSLLPFQAIIVFFVSIPKRDYWLLKLCEVEQNKLDIVVSIPKRDYWLLKLCKCFYISDRCHVSIPKRDYWLLKRRLFHLPC